MSQLDLALEAEISTRHLSFIETGRSRPSRQMVLRLAEWLDVPHRERNVLLLAAGYAPEFRERDLTDPGMAAARRAVDLVLTAHEPYPALAFDRWWNLVAANRMIAIFLAGIDAHMLEPPLNVIRLSLHPEGLAPRIVNYGEWRSHLLLRVRHQVERTADLRLRELLDEVSAYQPPEGASAEEGHDDLGGIAVPLRMKSDQGILSALSTTTVFGTPVDITLSELAIESFFPADEHTAEVLRRAATAMADVGEEGNAPG
jgi:transcriptional regulator with XRE-family HTH domain